MSARLKKLSRYLAAAILLIIPADNVTLAQESFTPAQFRQDFDHL